MAKIIYAVAGEGFGHSSRSHLIGQRLIDAGHDVMFVGSKKSLVYLKQYFKKRVKPVFGLSFAYSQGGVDAFETVWHNLSRWAIADKVNERLFRRYIEPFAPDLLITDFEPFCAWWAIRNKVPFISIDHQHFLTLCKLRHRPEKWFERLTASLVTESYYVAAVAYIIINFFKSTLNIDAAVLAPPVVRKAVTEKSCRQGDYILLYLTAAYEKEHILDILHKFADERFYVYGFDEDSRSENCIFKKRSTEGFLNDLAGCRGVVASAGFSLISECMYFKKKMLLIALAGQYEQIVNADYVERLGLGINAKTFDEQSMGRFLEELEKPMGSGGDILWPDNEKFFEILQETLNKLKEPVSIKINQD